MFYIYPKSYLSPADLVNNLITKGMIINFSRNVEDAIKQIGYYRLKGYFFDFFDLNTGQYIPGTNFEDVLKSWSIFVKKLKNLINSYSSVVNISKLFFPSDWANHII